MALKKTAAVMVTRAVRPTKVVGPDEIVARKCPYPWCEDTIQGTWGALALHYKEKHRCGRCNAGLHRKCKMNICACPCQIRDLDKVMKRASSTSK